MPGLSQQRAKRLKPLLDAFADERPWGDRVRADPVELVLRYSRPDDVELAALLCACLAYGRADLFKPKLRGLLDAMGEHPADWVRRATVSDAKKLLDGFVYRFNLPADLAVLLLGAGALLREHGSLEPVFLEGLERGAGDPLGPWHGALSYFTQAIRAAAPAVEIKKRLGKVRGLHHLLPSPLGAGAAKRLQLFLRWVVRGPDAIDRGLWKRVGAARLMIPLDTHVYRMAGLLGLTARKGLTWRTALEVTESLRQLDPLDPVRYDFALCHYGMSGACPARPRKDNCLKCPLKSECRVGKRLK
jgi:uncharacterized protein (TIGR02757 family)